MEPIKSESKKSAVKNKSKSIKVNYGQDELYTIDFINEVSKLSIVAKTSSDILSLIYTNKFSLEDIQKTKYFNNYESIDDCLEEIFAKLDKNEAKIEKINDSTINIKIPLDNIRSPFIEFSLIKREKNDNEKYSELLNIVQHLNNRINFLENLLKAKNNKDYKKDLETFKGTVIEAKCIGKNEIDDYFDLKQDYALRKQEDNYNFLSFVFKCKDDKDIPLIVETFNNIKNEYDDSGNIFTRVKNNKIFIEVRIRSTDLFDIENLDLGDLLFSSGESVMIKTEAIPRDIFGKFDEEKMLKFLLGIEVEFSNLSPQMQMFAKYFQEVSDEFHFSSFLNDIVRDIYVNLLSGNLKYKLKKYMIEQNLQGIHQLFCGYIYSFAHDMLKLERFKEYKKINFDQIELNLITTKYQAGFNFIIKVPKYSELVDDIINGRINQNW